MTDSHRVRRAAVAGSFYPGDPGTLRRDLDTLLGEVKGGPQPGRPVVLVEPHAGYIYSGGVAAHGYKLLQDLGVTNVIIISPSHMEHFPFVSIFDGEAYETPLGKVPVDRDLARHIASSDTQLRTSDRGHIQDKLFSREHALEVQLPFLQTVLDKFRVVPIVMGEQNWEACRVLGNALGPLLTRPDTIVIVSSDLSHFYPSKIANEMDGLFLNLLTQMDPWRLYESVKQKSCEACGAGPVIAAVIAAQHVKSPVCRVLSTANSGDVTGDHDRVVGYACVAIFEPYKSVTDALDYELQNELAFGKGERAFLLQLARHAIAGAVGTVGESPASLDSAVLDAKRGAFVTLKARNRLRGCVGTIEPTKPLRKVIADMAIAAAVGDPRFQALSIQELDGLHIEISVLSPIRQVDGPEDIVVGQHGVFVQRGERSGLLLPQVAQEHGWSALEFVEFTCEKAGLPRSSWRDDATSMYVFTATVFGEERELSH